MEAFFFPIVKRQPAVVGVGVFLALVGHFFRIGAMWTAGSNFNHEIMQRVSYVLMVKTFVLDAFRFLTRPVNAAGWV